MYSWRVPLNAYKKLTVVASRDMGDLVPRESALAVYKWALFWNVSPAFVWVVLIPLLLLKANRSWQAWLLLLPVIAIYVGLFFLNKAISVPGGSWTLCSLPVALGALWLLSDKLPRRKHILALVLAAVVMAVVGGVGYLAYMGRASWVSGLRYLAVYGGGALVLLLGLTASGLSCRKKYVPTRLMLWLLLWVLAITLLYSVIAGSMSMIGNVRWVARLMLTSWGDMLGSAWKIGRMMGPVLYVALLPFMLLTFLTKIYASRFRSVFGFEGRESGSTEEMAA